jgi:CheY-like chemotaxis protein
MSRTVLIVEDDPVIRRLLKHIFERQLDCRVVEAADGLHGLHLAIEEKPDLIVLDIQLPMLDGLGVLESLRANHDTRNVACIAISGVSDRDVIRRLLDFGLSAYILKPIDIASTTRRLEQVLADIGTKKNAAGTDDSQVGGRLLVLDADPSYRAFVGKQLAGRYEVEEAASGIDGVQQVYLHPPDVILVGENLPQLPESLIPRAVRKNEKTAKTLIFLASDAPDIEEQAKSWGYNGVIVKSFVANQFRREFDRVMPPTVQAAEARLAPMHGDLERGLQTVAPQALTLVLGDKVESSEEQTAVEIGVAVTLSRPDGNPALRVQLESTHAVAQAMSAHANGDDSGVGEGELFGQIVQTIAARVRKMLEERGLRLTASVPSEVVGAAGVSTAPFVRQSFRTSLGVVQVSLLLCGASSEEYSTAA